jgi:putative addiction module component (TIGR02574 family)
MAPTLHELKCAAAGLPTPERAELAHFLLQSLEPEEEGWAAAWQEELALRLKEIRSGQVVGIPAEEVIDRLRERYP